MRFHQQLIFALTELKGASGFFLFTWADGGAGLRSGNSRQSRKIVDQYGLALGGYDAKLFPFRKETTHGEETRRGELCQLLARKSNLDMSIDSLPHLIEQPKQLIAQP